MGTVRASLSKELTQRGYGEAFQTVWLQPFLERNAQAPTYEAETFEIFLRSLQPQYGSAAWNVLTSIERADGFLNRFNEEIRSGRSFLDVGCGFGGSLVSAAKRGATVFGIELDAGRAKAANALLNDNAIEGRVGAVNVFSAEFDALPQFDFICSNNVIEHVNDARGFIQKLCGKLTKTGTLFLEIPNKDAASLVLSDPHYRLPLIVQLSHHSAKALFEQHLKGRDVYGQPYGVGEYFKLPWYLEVIEKCGLRPKVDHRENAIASIESVRSFTMKIAATLNENIGIFSGIDAYLREEIYTKGREYLTELNSNWYKQEFHDRYQSAAWLVTATRL